MPANDPGASGATEFRMPSLGADMQAGTVVTWLVKPGDHVKHGDVVAEIETEKGVFEVEIASGGIVDELIVAKGAKVPVGTVLARLRSDGAPPAEVGAAAKAPAAIVAPSPAAPTPAEPPTKPASVTPAAPAERPTIPAPVTPSGRVARASPLARKIAEAKGIDLTQMKGTGPNGAITKADVERAALQPEPLARAPAPEPSIRPPAPEPLARPTTPPGTEAIAAMRHAVAAAVSRSKREIPHYYLSADINLGPALQWLTTQNQSRAVTDRILPAAVLLKSVALALRKFLGLNGFWTDGAHHPAEAIHVGVAISLRGGGLIAPAIHDADRLSIDQLMRALSDLVRRARSGGLRGSEMTDATITVSNLGDEGAASVFGVIYPPQVALVGFGNIRERPWADNGMLGVRPAVTATLAADHRATDGHYGSQFLAEIDRLLQAPESL
ncbi:MAG TPA: dihydrolipoamide acetyltransferase family protein [Gemmatimonadaceae bacterium]|nr:dihydrolipoamide acetyltransferase family protein [Gemmatimonadaceae bacterium]